MLEIEEVANIIEFMTIGNQLEISLIPIKTVEEGMLSSWQSYEGVEPV